MGKKKIVLDTNIYISALGYRGKERDVLRKGLSGEFALYLSEDILKEIERVLEYPKFSFTSTQKDAFKLLLSEAATMVSPIIKLDLLPEDPSDNMFLEAAIAVEADYLITGNKHLLRVKQIGKTKIVKTAQFLEQNK